MSKAFFEPLYENKFQIACADSGNAGPHSHSFLELGYITSNTGTHCFGNKAEEFREGDYFIVDYGVVHSYKSYDGKGVGVINCLFLPDFFDSALHGCESFGALLNNYLIRFSGCGLPRHPTNQIFKDDGTVKALLSEMKEEYEHKKPGYLELIRCDLIKIILFTMRKINSNIIENTAVSSRIMKEIEDHCTENITLSAIAKKLHFSLPYTSLCFKNDMGKNFSDALKKARIEIACRLLANSDKKVSEIAAECGYKDLKTFYSVFKQIMGVSPGAFRKTVKFD